MKTKRLLSLALAMLMAMSVFAGLNLTVFADSDWETDPVSFPDAKNGWYQSGETWYYVVNGFAKTGWLKDKGKWYYLDPDDQGAMVAERPMVIKDKCYVFSKSGAMLNKLGWNKLVISFDNESYTYWWYLNKNGDAKSGWLKDSGKWYYLIPGYCVMAHDMVLPVPVDQEITEKTKWYAFDKSGAMVSGKWVKITEEEYLADVMTGAYADKSERTIWYYATANGELAKGWKQINKKWYYFDTDDCEMVADNWVKGAKSTEENPIWYYLTADGAMATGWKYLYDSEWHYFGTDGAERYGWAKVSGKWYYLYPEDLKIDGVYVERGSMATGWLELEDGIYYLSESGAMVTGKQVIDGEAYTFAGSGRLIVE